ncbi:hypothetical protein AGMMS49992_18840 [Clostridia bacterium]|nr:hypothetical protein AGMMS49992_18840 [Clostridia bacterium]
MNILLTCIGRRVELIQAFRNAAQRLDVDLFIYGADISITAPALFFCDRQIHACRISTPGYIPQLLAICEKEHIDALIPTIDTDLLILAQNREMFTKIGTTVFISDAEKIGICRDKRLTSLFFERCGLKSPMPVDDASEYTGSFPCFIKPVNGSSSINAFKVDNQCDLEMYAVKISDYIVQPYIEGMEFTVDIFCDLVGKPVYITPRERIAVRSGEVLKTRIVQDEQIIADCKRIIDVYEPCGAITVQLVRHKYTGEDYYIEINPRFGGGASLSMKAGADSAEMMLRILDGESIAYSPYAARDGAVYSRFDQSVQVNGYTFEEIKAVIFDLDDTLYSEKEYVRSGFREVAKLLSQVTDAFSKLWAAFEDGKPAIDTFLIDEGVYDEELKQVCLEVYRNHDPDIHLYNGARELLVELKQNGIKLGILTDGCPNGQRKKLHALGLESLVDEIIITDDIGGERFRKPCDIAYRIIQQKMGVPFDSMLYVGDNIGKDFQAPHMLGMRYIWFNNPSGLYYSESNIPCDFGIKTIKDDITDLKRLICKKL